MAGLLLWLFDFRFLRSNGRVSSEFIVVSSERNFFIYWYSFYPLHAAVNISRKQNVRTRNTLEKEISHTQSFDLFISLEKV